MKVGVVCLCSDELREQRREVNSWASQGCSAASCSPVDLDSEDVCLFFFENAVTWSREKCFEQFLRNGWLTRVAILTVASGPRPITGARRPGAASRPNLRHRGPS
jgi:hypothetical protein